MEIILYIFIESVPITMSKDIRIITYTYYSTESHLHICSCHYRPSLLCRSSDLPCNNPGKWRRSQICTARGRASFRFYTSPHRRHRLVRWLFRIRDARLRYYVGLCTPEKRNGKPGQGIGKSYCFMART